MSTDDTGFKAALDEARQGSREGGVPIGAALVSAEGEILGQGHNMRIQNGSATLHVGTLSSDQGLALILTVPGRDIRLRECRTPPSHCLPRCNHVHQSLAV